MAKLKKDAIGVADLTEFLDNSSSFAFELKCLELLTKLGLKCQHGGSYTDPVTGKPRQFDIRAVKGFGKRQQFLAAIECKNLEAFYPLLVHRVPRLLHESFHEIVVAFEPSLSPANAGQAPALQEICRTVRRDWPDSPYAQGQPVGKGCSQVGRAPDGSIVGNDDGAYEKWSQALASSQSLLDNAVQAGVELTEVVISLIVPMLVVPDGSLWIADFDATGARTGSPKSADRCSLFVDHRCEALANITRIPLRLSHLEIVTLSGLKSLIEEIITDRSTNGWFLKQSVRRGIDAQ